MNFNIISSRGRRGEKMSKIMGLKIFNLKIFNSIQKEKRIIVRKSEFQRKKVLTWTGIELGSSRLPVRRADHSANRQIFFKKFILFNPVSNRQIGDVKKNHQQ